MTSPKRRDPYRAPRALIFLTTLVLIIGVPILLVLR